jgi:hypothetical protein
MGRKFAGYKLSRTMLIFVKHSSVVMRGMELPRQPFGEKETFCFRLKGMKITSYKVFTVDVLWWGFGISPEGSGSVSEFTKCENHL